jgi:hypothetical protein
MLVKVERPAPGRVHSCSGRPGNQSRTKTHTHSVWSGRPIQLIPLLLLNTMTMASCHFLFLPTNASTIRLHEIHLHRK